MDDTTKLLLQELRSLTTTSFLTSQTQTRVKVVGMVTLTSSLKQWEVLVLTSILMTTKRMITPNYFFENCEVSQQHLLQIPKLHARSTYMPGSTRTHVTRKANVHSRVSSSMMILTLRGGNLHQS